MISLLHLLSLIKLTNIPCDDDTTLFRLYEKPSSHIPKHISTEIPYMSEDTIRNDLHPGKLPIQELWDMLCKKKYHMDEKTISILMVSFCRNLIY